VPAVRGRPPKENHPVRFPALFLSALLAPAIASPCATVAPAEDSGAVLHNPDMGWAFYEFGKQMASGYAYPDVDYVAIAAYWNRIERQAAVYDFTGLDRLYDYWAANGKRVMLRLFAEDVGTVAPAYVLARLDSAERQSRTALGYTGYAEIDARAPYYRERLAAFLGAVAAHFSAAAGRPVETVDLRGFGLWGEWHSGFLYPGQPADLKARRDALGGILDLWSRAFPGIRLLLSYSHDPDSDPASWSDAARYDDFTRWSAFDLALAKPNISFRRDGVYGAMQPNERRFCEAAFAAGKAPFMSEFTHGYVAGTAARAVDDALSLHPNFICVYGYSGSAFHENDRAEFDRGLRAMGYRLMPISVAFPDTVPAGGNLTVTTRWANRGVGKALADFRLRLRLSDAAGAEAASLDAGATGSHVWAKGATYALSLAAPLGTVRPGTYRLDLSLVDPRTGRAIALPVRGGDAGHHYPVGKVIVKGAPMRLARGPRSRAYGGLRSPAASLRDARGRRLGRSPR
jgi:hypothetical protein